MSYCVNCGVELDAALARCPLCACPVMNPMRGTSEQIPAHPEQVEHIDNLAERRFAALIITILALFVASVCIVIDVSYHDGLGWSRFVIGSAALAWLLLTPPLFIRNFGTMPAIVADAVSIALFLFSLEQWTDPGAWFFQVAFPIVGTAFIIMMIGASLIRAGFVRGLRIVALVVFCTGIFVLCIEPVINGYLTGSARIEWSMFVLIPCTALALLLFVIDRRRKLKEKLAKRFHT